MVWGRGVGRRAGALGRRLGREEEGREPGGVTVVE